MTAEEFRRAALSFPEAVESAHMDHPDFRVRGKIFATLGYPDDQHGMISLPPEQQAQFVESNPHAFSPVKGFWGRRGATEVRLDAVAADKLEEALAAGWCKVAPKRLVAATLDAKRHV